MVAPLFVEVLECRHAGDPRCVCTSVVGWGCVPPENHDNTSYAVKEVNKSKRERKLVYQSYSPWSGKEDTVFMSDVSCELEQMTSRTAPNVMPKSQLASQSEVS